MVYLYYLDTAPCLDARLTAGGDAAAAALRDHHLEKLQFSY